MSGGARRAAESPVDSRGVRRSALAAPERLAAAYELASRAALPTAPADRAIEQVVVLGAGEAALAAAALAALAAPLAGVPVVPVDGGELPAFSGPGTLVIACSAQGEDWETVAAAGAAAGTGARLVVVSGGGRLASLAADRSAPLVPTGAAGQAAPGFVELLAAMLAVTGALGVVPKAGEMTAAAVDQLERRRGALTAPGGGPAAEVARRVGRTMPVVHGASGIGWVAARRWKSQVNAWAKAPAFAASQPEASYDEVCGFGQNGDVTRQVMTLVVLRSDHEPSSAGIRFVAFCELAREALAGIVEVRAEGHGPLAQLLDLVLVGDLVALDLAAHEEIDPGPVPAAEEVAARVAAEAGGARAESGAGSGGAPR